MTTWKQVQVALHHNLSQLRELKPRHAEHSTLPHHPAFNIGGWDYEPSSDTPGLEEMADYLAELKLSRKVSPKLMAEVSPRMLCRIAHASHAANTLYELEPLLGPPEGDFPAVVDALTIHLWETIGRQLHLAHETTGWIDLENVLPKVDSEFKNSDGLTWAYLLEQVQDFAHEIQTIIIQRGHAPSAWIQSQPCTPEAQQQSENLAIEFSEALKKQNLKMPILENAGDQTLFSLTSRFWEANEILAKCGALTHILHPSYRCPPTTLIAHLLTTHWKQYRIERIRSASRN